MKQLILAEIVPHINGTQIKGKNSAIINRAVTKPGKVRSNTLYFVIDSKKLKRNTVFDKSAVIVTDKPDRIVPLAGEAAVVKVDNIINAYWDFVRYYRSLFQLPVIGVTGTCGKTTTTEMIKAILAQQYKVASSYDGNNAWYLSLPYLLTINDTTEAAVFEMGVAKPGDLDYMCKHYQPQIGVLLNIGTYHLAGCKTQENYTKAKIELLEGLGFSGTLILNSDDERIKQIDLSSYKGKILYFGLSDSADFRANHIRYAQQGMKFVLRHNHNSYNAFVPGLGQHNVYNALAAIAACYSMGINIGKAVRGLEAFTPVRQHMQLHTGLNGCKIIDDTWNCTPPSMECGLEVLNNLGKSMTKVAVMGYMPRLGEAGNEEYLRIGRKVAESETDYLVVLGEEPKQIGIEAVNKGFDKDRVFYCSTADQLYNTLAPLTGSKTILLFKFPYKYRLSKISSYRDFMKKILGNQEDVPNRK